MKTSNQETSPTDEIATILSIAIQIAREAGDQLLTTFRSTRTLEVRSKASKSDVVSEADHASEQLIVSMISEQRPRDGIVAEEGATAEAHSGFSWVVDPLDGTVNFLYGIAQWCVSLAVIDATGSALVGVVFDPVADELFVATRGEGATLNSEQISVNEVDSLKDALIGTGFAYEPNTRGSQADLIPKVLRAVKDIRRPGAAALDLCWVACGRTDGFFEASLARWDRAAGALIVKEANGVTTDLCLPPDSHDDSGIYGFGIVASGHSIHNDLVSLANGTSQRRGENVKS